jgi:hypothetical protein
MIDPSTPSVSSSSRRRPRLWLALCALLAAPALAVSACGGETSDPPGTDTNTNWLKSCSSDTECDLGSTCSCGRCTVECDSDADCADLSSAAACVATSERCPEARLCMPRPAELELGSSSAGSASCAHAANDYSVDDPALCFGRELPECPPGSSAFMDACGCGCGTAPDYPRRCRAQCELAAGSCEAQSFEDFPDFDSTRESWLSSANGGFAGVVAGECANGGRRFLYTANGTTSEARVFTADGLFLGLGTSTDDIEATCWGQSYWPEPARCERATVTEVLNEGLGFGELGQVVRLPWGEGPPEPLF